MVLLFAKIHIFRQFAKEGTLFLYFSEVPGMLAFQTGQTAQATLLKKPYTPLNTPNNKMPATHTIRQVRMELPLRNVGMGLSLGVMNIALMMSK